MFLFEIKKIFVHFLTPSHLLIFQSFKIVYWNDKLETVIAVTFDASGFTVV